MRLDHVVVTLIVTCQFESHIGKHFVGIHVRGSAGASLVPVHRELVVVLPSEDGLRRLLDRRQLLFAHCSDVCVGLRCSEFDDSPGLDELRIAIDGNAGDPEVFQGSRRLNAVVRISGDVFLAQKILLRTGRTGRGVSAVVRQASAAPVTGAQRAAQFSASAINRTCTTFPSFSPLMAMSDVAR